MDNQGEKVVNFLKCKNVIKKLELNRVCWISIEEGLESNSKL